MTPKARLGWVRLLENTGDAGLTCRRCGVSRPTLRKWWRRYQTAGLAGLQDRSRRPANSPGKRVTPVAEQRILTLRRDRRLGIKRLRNELQRQHDIQLSIDTVHKVLCRHGLNRLKRPKKPRRKRVKRYAKRIPGERVQMDVCKIAPRCYQYTAIDDCSRLQVVAVFPQKTAASTVQFLEQVVEEMPVPIQRIQTDRGQEFTAYKVQDLLREWRIRFRPVRPRSPHLNGKVERVQRTNLEEFWPTVDPKDPEIDDKIAEWQSFYNWNRSHDSLGGQTPIDRLCDRLDDTPLTAEVHAAYDPEAEFVVPRDDLPIREKPASG